MTVLYGLKLSPFVLEIATMERRLLLMLKPIEALSSQPKRNRAYWGLL